MLTGDVVQANTSVLDSDGHLLPDLAVAWRSSREEVAAVDGAGDSTAAGHEPSVADTDPEP